MHVSPVKHNYAWLPRKCDTDYWTDRQTDGQTEAKQSDPYVPQATQKTNMNQYLKGDDFK